MTDATTTEVFPEPVPPIQPAPEAVAELAGAPPEAEAPGAPVVGERVLPEIEHPIGPLRQAVLDALADADEPLSVARILAELPAGTSRNSAETAIRREHESGRIKRVAPGTYILAKPKPPEPPKPPSPPAPLSEDEAIWFDALERWMIDRSWDVEELGLPPDAPNNNIPPDIRVRFNDRLRKRLERRRGAEIAATARAAADRQLRNQLLAATHGNFQRGPGIDDVSPIRLAMELVPLDEILLAIRQQTDRKLFPKNQPATTWRELRLLKAVAERYCLFTVVPSLVAAWSAAGKPRENSPPADQMPADIDDLRSRHDDPHAPPGPHNLQPDAAPSGPHTAPAAPPAQPSAVLDGDAPGPAAAALLRNYAPEPDMNPDIAPDMNPDGEANSLALSGVVADMAADIPPAVEGREAILRAFKRNGAQPQPAPGSLAHNRSRGRS